MQLLLSSRVERLTSGRARASHVFPSGSARRLNTPRRISRSSAASTSLQRRLHRTGEPPARNAVDRVGRGGMSIDVRFQLTSDVVNVAIVCGWGHLALSAAAKEQRAYLRAPRRRISGLREMKAILWGESA